MKKTGSRTGKHRCSSGRKIAAIVAAKLEMLRHGGVHNGTKTLTTPRRR